MSTVGSVTARCPGLLRALALTPAKSDWGDVAVAVDGAIVLPDWLNLRLRRLHPTSGRWSVVARGDHGGRTLMTHGDTRFLPAPDETCRNEPGDAELAEVRRAGHRRSARRLPAGDARRLGVGVVHRTAAAASRRLLRT